MKIERAIYASLPIGIDSDTNGLQYYSYTPGFKNLLEQDTSGALKGLTAGGYKFPNGSDWLRDLPNDVDVDGDLSEYPLRIPETTAEANSIECRIKRFSPYSLSYKPYNYGGEDGALFLFGKNLGMDWSGGRPGNPYIYFVACAANEISQAPIFYCSSSAVTCDISRAEFYPESSVLKKPNLLEYIDSLKEDNGIAPLCYSAGFDEITVDDIVEFIKVDEHIDVLLSMFSALIEYKDGNMKCRMVIADTSDNILMWIAALSYIFPTENSRKLSFSTYTFAPEDFDINGVFVPSLNMCPFTTRSGYDFNIVRNAYAVYDFQEGYFAPDVEVKTGLFMSIIKNSFEINTSLIDNYKRFISERTEYRNINSEYMDGYDLFSFMANMVKYDLSKAVDFAIKYAVSSEKKALLDKFLSECIVLAQNGDNNVHIKKYIEYCTSNNIEEKESIESSFVDRFLSAFFDENSSEQLLDDYCNIAKDVFGISSDKLGNLLIEHCKLESILGFVTQTNSSWRILFISRALCLFSNSKNIQIRANSEIGKIQTKIITRLINSDTVKNTQLIVEYIKELFSVTKKTSSQVGLCDSVLCGLQSNNLSNCGNQVLSIISQMYITGNTEQRREMMLTMDNSVNSEKFIKSIIAGIKNEPDVCRMISSMQDFFLNGGSVVKQHSDEAKKVVIAALGYSDNTNLKQKNENIYAAYKFLQIMSDSLSISVLLSEYQKIFDFFLSNVLEMAPDFILERNYVIRFKELSDHISKKGGQGNPEMLQVFVSLCTIKNDIGSKKQDTCFSFKEKLPYQLVNLSALSNVYRQTYIVSIGTLLGEHWAITEEMPDFKKLYSAEKKDKPNYDEAIFNVMFKYMLKKVKHNGRQAANVIELSLLWHYDSVLFKIDQWLSECNVSSGIVSYLDKDIKAIVEMKKGANNGVLDKIDSGELQDYTKLIRSYYDNNSGGVLNSIKSLFKRK